jgi:hypothetical protein
MTIHIEFSTGPDVTFAEDEGAQQAQDNWDNIMDDGYDGRTDITFARWTVPGTNKPRTKAIYGYDRAEQVKQALGGEVPNRHDRFRAEQDAACAANDAHDRRENRRSYYLRTGR